MELTDALAGTVTFVKPMSRGHLVQRSAGSWSIVLYLGRDARGKKRQRWITFRGTKRDAAKRLTRLLYELDVGVDGTSTQNL